MGVACVSQPTPRNGTDSAPRPTQTKPCTRSAWTSPAARRSRPTSSGGCGGLIRGNAERLASRPGPAAATACACCPLPARLERAPVAVAPPSRQTEA